MRKCTLATLAIGLAAVLLAGCGRRSGEQDQGGPSADSLQAATAAEDSTAEGTYVAAEGRFKITWPPECEGIHIRTLPDTTTSDPKDLLWAHFYCDRPGHPNEGCAVTVHFKLKDEFGGPPTPRAAIDLVQQRIAHFQVQIVAQTPVKRHGVQGVQVQCREPNGSGMVWIEGFLLKDRVYLVSGWMPEGDLFGDPVYQTFFESFTAIDDG